jgi:hypothetical protein
MNPRKHVLATNDLVLAISLIQRFPDPFDNVDDIVDIDVIVSKRPSQQDNMDYWTYSCS